MFYSNSTIWVLFPQAKTVSFVTERRGLQLTQQTLCFTIIIIISVIIIVILEQVKYTANAFNRIQFYTC